VDSLLRVLECLWQRDELCVRKGAIVISTRIAGVSFDALSITLHRTRKVSLLKQSIAFLARYGRLRRVNVCGAVRGRLGALNIFKFIQNIRRAVFSEGFFEEPDCVGQVFLFGVGRANAAVCFCDKLVIRAQLKTKKINENISA
jgi:hypothetical protein